MPFQLKDELKDRLQKKLTRQGHDDLFEKIADETKATTIEELTAYLAGVNHPALSMKPLV
jgi:CO dehydrogenase/acetyl-CoA synthase beta subunit